MKIIVFIAGFVVLVVGIALCLREWDSVLVVIKGLGSPTLAVVGIAMMFAATVRRGDH